jgi:hypothetical protein
MAGPGFLDLDFEKNNREHCICAVPPSSEIEERKELDIDVMSLKGGTEGVSLLWTPSKMITGQN